MGSHGVKSTWVVLSSSLTSKALPANQPLRVMYHASWLCRSGCILRCSLSLADLIAPIMNRSLSLLVSLVLRGFPLGGILIMKSADDIHEIILSAYVWGSFDV